MLDRLRHFIVSVIAPELVRDPNAVEEGDGGEGDEASALPVFDAASEGSPLGLRGMERERTRKLEDVAEFLKNLDPASRDRIVAYARPRRTGRRQVLTRCESNMDRWYADHPNA